MTLDNQQAYWDSVARQKKFTHPVNIALMEILVTKDAFILDFGCGYGRVVKILNENGFKHVKGFDSSIELINRGRQNGINDLSFIGQPEDLQLGNNSVDCILLFAVLTCIPSNHAQVKLMDVLYRKLKQGGLIYISDYYLQKNSVEVSRYEHLNGDIDN